MSTKCIQILLVFYAQHSLIYPFHIPFTHTCYTDIESRKEIYVIYTTCLVVYHQEKTQNADFAGDFAVYVDDYA